MAHHKRTLSVCLPVLMMMIVMASVEARNLLEATPDNEPDLSEPQEPVELPHFPSLPQPTLPSLPQPQLPSLPLPELPSLPIPQLPSLPSLPIPQLPSLPIPQLPLIPQFPSIPTFPNPSLAASKASRKP
nr:proteoglycan 4 [Ipomoea batatas]GMC85559.1 proteoglycan 4 [Ipomoea batatas]